MADTNGHKRDRHARTARLSPYDASGRPTVSARVFGTRVLDLYLQASNTMQAQVTDYSARAHAGEARSRSVDVGPHLGYHDDEAPMQ